MSRLSADAKEFIYPRNPATGTRTSYVMRRLQENRENLGHETAPVSVPAETLSQQQSHDRDPVAVVSAVHANRSLPQDGSQSASRQNSNPSSPEEQFLMRTNARAKVLEEFQSTIVLLANDPGQYNAALEFLLLILEPYFDDESSMEFVAGFLITTAWDTNFQYLAAKLAKEIDGHSNYFRPSLVEAVNNEVKGEIFDLSSFTLLVSELFVVFPAEFVSLLYNCINKLLNEDEFDYIKTICKVLKLNAQSLEAYNSVEYVNVLRHLKNKQASVTNGDTKKFIDITLNVIEARDSRHLNGNSHLQNGVSNVRDRLPNRPITNSQFIAHHDHVYSPEDCEYGGIIYGPDSQPMTEDEMAFLETAAVEAELVDEFNSAFNE